MNLPPHEARASKLVDEVTTSWSMLSFSRCLQTGREMEVSVPLYYGSLMDPQVGQIAGSLDVCRRWGGCVGKSVGRRENSLQI